MLELVLALPILLFIMALIINYGTVAAWKVRENSVARLAVWEMRWPRSGSTQSRARAIGPPRRRWNLPTRATCGHGRQPRRPAGGPRPVAGGDRQFRSAGSDPGLREGSADLDADYPMLAKMGNYTISPDVADRRQVAVPADGDGEQLQRRIPVLYTLAEAPASLVNAYVQAVMAIDAGAFRRNWRRWTTTPISFTTVRSSAGVAPHFQPRFQLM